MAILPIVMALAVASPVAAAAAAAAVLAPTAAITVDTTVVDHVIKREFLGCHTVSYVSPWHESYDRRQRRDAVCHHAAMCHTPRTAPGSGLLERGHAILLDVQHDLWSEL